MSKKEFDEAKRKRTVQAMFKTWQKTCIPKHASHAQRNDMKHSFYAGSAAMFEIMKNIGEDESVSEESSIAILNGLERELYDFFYAAATSGFSNPALGTKLPGNKKQ